VPHGSSKAVRGGVALLEPKQHGLATSWIFVEGEARLSEEQRGLLLIGRAGRAVANDCLMIHLKGRRIR
jgi:hypothetical protein